MTTSNPREIPLNGIRLRFDSKKRFDELVSSLLADVGDAADGTYIAVQRLKGSLATTQRLITTSNPLMKEQAVVTEYINGLKPGELLFRDENGKQFKRFHINYLMRYFGKRAGIPRHKWFPHVAKHSAGTLMRQTGSGIEDIADHLGHKNINHARV
jgi:integrase